MEKKPQAAGLTWPPGRGPIWRASRAAIKAGFKPRWANLSYFANDKAALEARCRRLTVEMNDWLAGRRALVQRLIPELDIEHVAIDWARTFDALAAELLGEFGSLVRGFRQATRPAIVRQFLRTPGRAQVHDRVISVLLDPSPYHVALHISGMDDPLPSVSWMGGRRLEFRLLGL